MTNAFITLNLWSEHSWQRRCVEHMLSFWHFINYFPVTGFHHQSNTFRMSSSEWLSMLFKCYFRTMGTTPWLRETTHVSKRIGDYYIYILDAGIYQNDVKYYQIMLSISVIAGYRRNGEVIILALNKQITFWILRKE